MKSGFIRTIDPLGRVTIPIEWRKAADIKDGDPVEIIPNGNEITLRKYRPGCVFCGNTKDVRRVMDVTVCRKCAASMAVVFREAEE